MQLTHRFTVPVGVAAAWAAFNDLPRVAPCFPGATLTKYDGESFAGSVKVKLGPISLQYNGTGRVTERDEAVHRAVVEARGKDRRGNGTATATVTATLAPDGADSTAVTVVTDLTVTGKPAQFGRGVMQDVGDKLLVQFAACLETTLAGEGAGAGESAGAAVGRDGAGPGDPARSPEGTPGPPSPPAPATGPVASAPGDAGAGVPLAGRTPAGPAAAGGTDRTDRTNRTDRTPAAALDLGRVLLPVVVRRALPVLLLGGLLVLLLRLLRRRR